MERRLRDSQFGFMPGRGVADAIFAVRQRMEKQGKIGLRVTVCIYLEKAYDRVPRQEVWRRNREKGLPDNYVMRDRICMKEREPGQTPMYMGSEEITICGGNEGVKVDERSYQGGLNKG